MCILYNSPKFQFQIVPDSFEIPVLRNHFVRIDNYITISYTFIFFQLRKKIRPMCYSLVVFSLPFTVLPESASETEFRLLPDWRQSFHDAFLQSPWLQISRFRTPLSSWNGKNLPGRNGQTGSPDLLPEPCRRYCKSEKKHTFLFFPGKYIFPLNGVYT